MRKLFALKASSLFTLGIIAAAYALLEGVEAVGLWRRRRWAEYLTFIATTILLTPEIYELTGKISVFKILALVINVLVVIYLLFAKRLFGLRGGGRVEAAEIQYDSDWQALESVLAPYRDISAVPTGRAAGATSAVAPHRASAHQNRAHRGRRELSDQEARS